MIFIFILACWIATMYLANTGEATFFEVIKIFALIVELSYVYIQATKRN
jgi:hypothetical protein